MSAMLGFEPRRVVRVERCVLREASRSAVLASSSDEGATCWDVMSHCSISVFSALEYCAESRVND